MLRRSCLSFIAIICTLIISAHSLAATITVNLDGSADYTTIQTAINAAANGDQVIVAQGTYVENIKFNGKNIVLTSTNPLDPDIVDTTIIDGGGNGTVVTFAGNEDPDCILTGFIITKGNRSNGYGGGIDGQGTTATISNCTITNNAAFYGGGGLFGCNGTIENCNITYNTAMTGGGIYCYNDSPTIKNCVISHNESEFEGAGINLSSSDAKISKCTISENVANWEGGGLFFHHGGSPVIEDCIFAENIARAEGYILDRKGGGGAFLLGGSIYPRPSNPTFKRCIFRGNIAGPGLPDYTEYIGGGGVFIFGTNPTFYGFIECEIVDCEFIGNTVDSEYPDSVTYGGGLSLMGIAEDNMLITNCSFRGNKSDKGGGLFCSYLTQGTIQNCTISGNSAKISGGGISAFSTDGSVELINSISWSNQPDELEDVNLGLYVNYCDIQGGWEGIEIIDEDPLFVSAGYWDPNDTPENMNDDFWVDGDYHLRWTSPCINAGDPNYIVEEGEFDIDGEPRIMTGRVDMGADEVGPKQADFTRDGIINADDFSVLSNSWQTTPVDEAWYILSDLWQDEVIDITDLAVFVEDWMWIVDWN